MGGFSIFASVPHPQSGRKTVGGVSEATKAIVIGTLESLVTSEGEEGGLRVIVSALATIVYSYNMEMGPIEKKWVWQIHTHTHSTYCISMVLEAAISAIKHCKLLFFFSFSFFFFFVVQCSCATFAFLTCSIQRLHISTFFLTLHPLPHLTSSSPSSATETVSMRFVTVSSFSLAS